MGLTVRKYLSGIVAVVVVIALAVGLGIRTGKIDNPFASEPKAGPKTETTVGKDGGTFTFPDGVVITVPKGAVKEDTTLSAGGITPLRSQDAGPFGDSKSRGVRAGAVKFDVSLSRDGQNDIQPAKPLEVKVPLKGKFKPAGVDTRLALLYTPGVDGKGYRLLPSELAKNGVLHGWLPHLSPKYVTYVSDQGLLDAFFPEKIKQDRSQCKQSVTVGDTKVKTGRNTYGWSLEDNSPIFACLSKGSEGYVRVGVVNQLYFILSVAATDNVRLAASSDDPEEEVAKRLADLLFPNGKIKSYVGRDGKLVGSIDVDTLPAEIQLRGDPNTFLAEGAWQALKLMAGIATGSGGGDIATTLLDVPSIISCVQGALNVSQGNLPSLAGAIDLVLSKCSEEVLNQVEPANMFNLSGRLFAIFSGLWDIVKTTRTAFDGIRMQVNGTMRIPVERAEDPNWLVGDWGLHHTIMRINADGTGATSSYDTGCGSNEDLQCRVVSDLSVKPEGAAYRLTRLNVRCITGDYQGPPVPCPKSVPAVGQSTLVTKINHYRIEATADSGFGNPNLCRSVDDIPESESYYCY